MSDERVTSSIRSIRHDGGCGRRAIETLAVEAPLQIKVNGESFTTTMRTPGDDEALARGLLYTEDIVPSVEAKMDFEVLRDHESDLISGVDVVVDEGDVAKPVAGKRSLLSSSSCGVCGTREPEDLAVFGPPLPTLEDQPFDLALIPKMLAHMAANQLVFDRSGGVHAAAAFSIGGHPLVVREDIGRHNAVDKVVGHLLVEGSLESAGVILVSGRVSYEIVYKTYRARIPVLLAVSAPSSMAVETGERLGMTVIAFCRGERATVYSGMQRVSPKTVPTVS